MIYDYIKLLQEKEILENKIYLAEQELKYKMLQDGVSEVNTKAGSIFLQTKGQNRKLDILPSQRELELSQQIADERAKAIEANKNKIYELEKTKFLADNELMGILNFSDLQDGLVEEKKKTYSKKLDVVDNYSIKVKLSKDFYLQSIDKDILSEMYLQSSKAKVADFAKKYFLGYYPDTDIKTAWNNYLI